MLFTVGTGLANGRSLIRGVILELSRNKFRKAEKRDGIYSI